MASLHSRPIRVLLAFAALVAVLFLTRTLWLPAFGYALVRNDGPAKADIAVVLAGDQSGRRILKAAQLAEQGYVPRVLVSGQDVYYGMQEADLAVAFAVRHGYSPDWFVPLRGHTDSTLEEARLIIPELRNRGVRSFLLVTSSFHTARAGRIFQRVLESSGGGITMRVVEAPDELFRPSDWWRARPAQKVAFLEWCKTIAYAVGI